MEGSLKTFCKSNIKMNEIYKTIGDNVSRIRRSKGLSQMELAYAMGLKSVGFVAAAEIYSDSKHFNMEHLIKIALILNVSLYDLLDGVHHMAFNQESNLLDR